MNTPIFPEIRFTEMFLNPEEKLRTVVFEAETLIRTKNPQTGQYHYISVKDKYTASTTLESNETTFQGLFHLLGQFHRNFIKNCYYVMHLSSAEAFAHSDKCRFPRLEEKDRVHIKATMNMPNNINSIL